MKLHILIIILLFGLIGASCEKVNNANSAPTQNPQTAKPELKIKPESSTPSANKKTTGRRATKEERAGVIEKSKADFNAAGMDISLIGEDKDIIIIKSASSPTHEIAMMLRDSLQDYRDVGFSLITITDNTGKVQKIDLTALDGSR